MAQSLATQRIAVLYGGASAEREVSLRSGRAVAAALRERGHFAQLIDPVDQPVAAVNWSQFDVAFIALHGTYGEDGGVQRELDELGVAYSGCGAEASAIAFNKLATKGALRQAEIPTPVFARITQDDSANEIARRAESIGYPLVVKPNCQGSSVGVTMVEHAGQLPQALSRCFHFDRTGLLEVAVPGTEWTVGVVNGLPLTPIRIESSRRFYDYLAKYHDESTSYHLADPNESPQLVERLCSLALLTCEAINTQCLSRVDMRLDEQDRPWVLEVNTIPGFTENSLLPKAATDVGLKLGPLCEQIIIARQIERKKRMAG